MTEKRFTFDIDNENGTDEPYFNNGTDSFYVNDADEMELFLKEVNELHKENQIKLEIVDAFIRGLEDEKGIAPGNKEFQCKMNFTIKILKKLKKDMLDPTDFKRVKELSE